MDFRISTELAVRALTTCAVSANGNAVRLNLESTDGGKLALEVPLACAQQLVMTLPKLLTRALRAQSADDSLRAVFPLSAWKLETAAQAGYLILTLSTPDEFDVSFTLTEKVIDELVSSLDTHHAISTPFLGSVS